MLCLCHSFQPDVTRAGLDSARTVPFCPPLETVSKSSSLLWHENGTFSKGSERAICSINRISGPSELPAGCPQGPVFPPSGKRPACRLFEQDPSPLVPLSTVCYQAPLLHPAHPSLGILQSVSWEDSGNRPILQLEDILTLRNPKEWSSLAHPHFPAFAT